MRKSTAAARRPAPLFEDPPLVRKLLALALLALVGGGAVFLSIESETTALAGCAFHGC